MVFILVWGTAALIVQLLGGGGGLTGVTLRLVAQPLWFIGIYLAMVAFTPPLLKLHGSPSNRRSACGRGSGTTGRARSRRRRRTPGLLVERAGRRRPG